MDEFLVPGKPSALWDEDSDLPVKVLDLQDFSESSADVIADVAESGWQRRAGLPAAATILRQAPPQLEWCLPAGLSFALCVQDPLCIVEQQNFDQLCSLLRCFHLIPGPKRRQLVDRRACCLPCACTASKVFIH